MAALHPLDGRLLKTVRRPRPQLDGLPALSPVVSALSFPGAHAGALPGALVGLVAAGGEAPCR